MKELDDPTPRDSGQAAVVVYLKGSGRIQRRIWRALVASPDQEMTTVELVRWCYPRWTGEPLLRHRQAILRAARRVAERVRIDRPGGVVFRARAETSSA